MEDFIVSFHLSSCLFLLPCVYVSGCQLLKQDRTVNVFYTFFRQTVRQAMEMLSGAEMVVRSLIDQGVKQVFGYPGGAVLDIYDALHTVGGIDHVLVSS